MSSPRFSEEYQMFSQRRMPEEFSLPGYIFFVPKELSLRSYIFFAPLHPIYLDASSRAEMQGAVGEVLQIQFATAPRRTLHGRASRSEGNQDDNQ